MRKNGRKSDELREINIIKNFVSHPEGSVLIEFGNTKVICNATIEDKVPNFLKGHHSGWITAEYGMIPRSTNDRMRRESKTRQSGRTMEIQRLIGRSLRSSVNLEKLGERTVTVDCDVIQADGGTRTASITGGFVALCLALRTQDNSDFCSSDIIQSYTGSVSIGKVDGKILLDLDYDEDSKASVDANFVFNSNLNLCEVQVSAEKKTFSESQFIEMLNISKKGVSHIFKLQNQVLNE